MKLYQKIFVGGLAVAGTLGLMGCDDPDNRLIYQHSEPNKFSVKFSQRVMKLEKDSCKLEVAYNRKPLVRLERKCGSFQGLVLYDEKDKAHILEVPELSDPYLLKENLWNEMPVPRAN